MSLYTVDNLESYGYKLVTWAEFLAADDRPEGLLERAVNYTTASERASVVYDPEGDAEGWMLVGERDEIIRETVDDLIAMEPIEGPLSPQELAH